MKLSNYLSSLSGVLSEYWQEIKTIIYIAFAFLNIDMNTVKILSILMAIDTTLGVIKSMYLKELRFTFKKLLWGLVSKSTVLLIPMLLALVSLGLGYNFKWVMELVLKILIVSEAISSITNILSIKEEKNIENTDYVSRLLYTIRDSLKNKMKNFIEKIEDEGKV